MPEVDPGFSVKKPVSVWNRPLKADAKGIFKSAGKAVLHGATGQWASLGADAVEGFSALGVGQDAGQLAWVLARRALMVAMEELAKESILALDCLSFLDLSDCILYRTDLEKADLSHAQLQGANLAGANLEGANLLGANLAEARIHEANMNNTVLTREALRDVKGKHRGAPILK